jgi:predicted metallo-beta-lactamase superfamily hydrolase
MSDLTPDTPVGFSHGYMVDTYTMNQYDHFLRWFDKRYQAALYEHRPVYPKQLVEFWHTNYAHTID